MPCVLLNPPEVIPDAIPLSIATIAGALRADRVSVYLDDMSQRFLNTIFSRKEFFSSSKDLTRELNELLSQKNMVSGSEERFSQLNEAIFKSDLFRSKVGWAKHVLKNWHEEYDYNDYRLAEQIRNYASEVFFLKHQDYSEWSGGESGLGTLSELCDSMGSFPDGMLSFLEVSLDRYDRFWKKHDGPAVLAVAARSAKQLQWGALVASFVRQRHPFVKVVLGGSFLSFFMTYYKYDLQRFLPLFKFFDAIVIHDGETAMRELYQKFRDEDESLNCKNTLSVVDDRIILKRPLHVEKLEELPAPYFGNLNFNNYLTPYPILPYAPTRGCPFQCAYCSYNLNYRHVYRNEDPTSVVSKVIELKKKYNTPYFYWSVSVLPAVYAKKLGDELIRRNADIRWFCQTRADKGFTEEVCDTLYRSGLRYIELGVESASDNVLRKMKKENGEKDVQHTVASFSQAGVPLDIFIISNHPGETVGDFEKTISFLNANEDSIVSISMQQFFLSAGSYIWTHPDEYDIEFEKYESDGEVVFWENYHVPYSGGVPLHLRGQKQEIAHLFMLQSSYYPRLGDGDASYFFKRYGMVSAVQHQFIFTNLGLSAEKSDYTSSPNVRWQLIENGWKVLPEDVYKSEIVSEVKENHGSCLVVSPINGESMMLEKTEMELFLALKAPLSSQELAIEAENIYNLPCAELEPEIRDVMKYWHKIGFLKRVGRGGRNK